MNRTRTAIAALLVLALAAPLARAQAEDVADVTSEDLRVEGNPKQRYFLIGHDPKSPDPEKGYSLLLVLPGGDGGEDFNDFVRRIYKNALPEMKYLVAQLVAVPSDKERQIIWPTAKSKDPKQTFTTESFIDAVVKEIKAKHKINDAEVFTLSWSSGGPAAYAASTMKETPIKGSLVAMSIFRPTGLNLPAAKGQKYFLLHSPDDQVTKYFFTRAARNHLEKNGATVTVKDYQGGHGWHGDVFGNIREGIEWLESAPSPREGRGPG